MNPKNATPNTGILTGAILDTFDEVLTIAGPWFRNESTAGEFFRAKEKIAYDLAEWLVKYYQAIKKGN
jgi:hypothetical protein